MYSLDKLAALEQLKKLLIKKDERIAELDDVGYRLERAYIKKCKEVEEQDDRIVELENKNCTVDDGMVKILHVQIKNLMAKNAVLQACIDAAVKAFTKLARPEMCNSAGFQKALLEACRELGPTAANQIEKYCLELYGPDFSAQHLNIKILTKLDAQKGEA